MKILLIGLIMMLGMAVPAKAEVSATKLIKIVESYQANGQKSDLFWILITLESQYIGMTWANERMVNERGRMIFCTPRNVRVNKEMLFRILKHYAEDTKAGRRVAYIPYGGVLLNALIVKWPC